MKKIFLLFVTLICSLSLGCIYTSTALARIYTTIHVPTRTDDVFHFKIKWWWSKKPTFNLIDTIGIMWRTNDPNNTRRILNNRSYPTDGFVGYTTGLTVDSGQPILMNYMKPYDTGANYARYKLEMLNTKRHWAIQGVINTSVSTIGRHSLTFCEYKCSYAHQYVYMGTDLGLSIKGGINVGFGINYGYSEDVHRHVRMNSYADTVQRLDDDV